MALLSPPQRVRVTPNLRIRSVTTPDLFARVEASYQAYLRSGRLEQAFRRWRRRMSVLSQFDDVGSLSAFFRTGAADPQDDKNAILNRLVHVAAGPQKDDAAGVLLIWLFLPGLIKLRNIYLQSPPPDPDLTAEMIAGFWKAARSTYREYPGADHPRVALRLTDGARFGARRMLRTYRAWAEHERWDLELIPHAPGPDAADTYDDTIEEIVRAGVVTRPEIHLVMATRGYIASTGACSGLTAKASRVARHRARQKLQLWFDSQGLRRPALSDAPRSRRNHPASSRGHLSIVKDAATKAPDVDQNDGPNR